MTDRRLAETDWEQDHQAKMSKEVFGQNSSCETWRPRIIGDKNSQLTDPTQIIGHPLLNYESYKIQGHVNK